MEYDIDDSEEMDIQHAEGQAMINEEGEMMDDEEGEGEESEGDDMSVEQVHESEEDLCYQAMVREIREVLNQYRSDNGLEPFHVDLLLEKPASEYAVYLVQNDPEPTYLESLINRVKEKEEYYPIVLVQRFEEDMVVQTESLVEQAHDLAELVLECDEEKEVCMDAKVNSMGIGISYSDEVLALTILLTKKIMAIKKVSAPPHGGIEIQGKMLTTNYGVYAIRIVYEDKERDPH